MIVDYKTDAVPAAALPPRVAYYAPQLRSYVDTVRKAGNQVSAATLLFLHPEGAESRPVPV